MNNKINKYLINFKFKEYAIKNKYHFYLFIKQNSFHSLDSFLQMLKWKKIHFIYIKHLRFLISSKFWKYFLNGSYIIVYSESLDILTQLIHTNLKLIGVVIHGFFINNLKINNLLNLKKFNMENFLILIGYLGFFFYIYFINLFYLKYIISVQIYFLKQKFLYETIY